MNLKAVIKGGLINGLATALALHWVVLALLYELVYEFEWPRMIGTPVSVLAVIVLFTSYLAEPDQLNGIKADEVLRPVVRSAMVGTYLVIAAHLLVGALIGGIEGLVFILIRAWRLGRRTGSAKSQTSANDL